MRTTRGRKGTGLAAQWWRQKERRGQDFGAFDPVAVFERSKDARNYGRECGFFKKHSHEIVFDTLAVFDMERHVRHVEHTMIDDREERREKIEGVQVESVHV